MTIQQLYKQKQDEWKSKIRNKPKHRWLHWLWYFIAFPFVWLWYNIRDWKSAVCVVISFILWSGSVWIWYLLAFITQRFDIFIPIGSAIWIWWISPVGSPFILLVTITAIAMKSLYDYLFGYKTAIKRNGGCYIAGEWYEYHNGYLHHGYIQFKLKRKYKKLYNIIERNSDYETKTK